MFGKQAIFVAWTLAMFCGSADAQGVFPERNKILGSAEIPSSYVPRMAYFGDGSLSWNQPISTNFGYNGYCGHVAWANAVSMYSGKKFDPSFFRYYSKGDLTPGLRPATLVKALNAATDRYGVRWHWKRFRPQSAWNNLKAALHQSYFGIASTPLPVTGLKNAPVLVVIQNSKTGFHWITVVGLYESSRISKSYIIANDNGSQTRIPYNWFMRAWSFTEYNNVLSTIMRTMPGFGNFSAIIPSI